MAEQLTFALPVHPALSRADFFVSRSNALALANVEATWPEGKLVLTGPRGAGKSHLAGVWASQSGALALSGRSLAGHDLSTPPAAVVVDDADAVAGDPAAEVALFHLHNQMLASGGRLLLTAVTPPGHWPLTLPDLASRLQATPVAVLDAPDDALLSAVLIKLFADRQLHAPATLIHYLILRIERSLAAAAAIVAALDARALATRRSIGRTMAAELLDNPDNSAP